MEKKYNLSLIYHEIPIEKKKYVRKQYMEKQNYKCMYCNEDILKSALEFITKLKIDWKLFPPNFLKHPIHLQYSHDTGLTEEVFHNYCNAVMWQYENK